MAAMMCLPQGSITATLAASAQYVVLLPEALAHMAEFRQLRWRDREAGGQLFGQLDDARVVVTHATGPYRGDTRTRCSYRSNPRAAQRAIELNRDRGFYYLGEWHTHPELRPRASAEDIATFETLLRQSDPRLSSLLLIIQGLEGEVDGLALYSGSGSTLQQWQLAGCDCKSLGVGSALGSMQPT
jgi:integrative and conjugative element protein (TIGR02256 family)